MTLPCLSLLVQLREFHLILSFNCLKKLFNEISRISPSVCPACLRQSLADPTGSVEAMGYGQTSFAGIQSNALLKAFLTVVNNAECNSAYSEESSDLPQGITAQQLCAWDPEGNKDTW